MDILFTKDAYKAVQKAGAKSPVFHEEDPWREVEVESRLIQKEDFPLIKKALQKDQFAQFIENRRVIRAIEMLEKIEAGDSKEVKIKTLQLFAETARDMISKTQHKYLFERESKLGALLPYFVLSVKYHPPERFSDAHVTIELIALCRGDKKERPGKASLSISREELKGGTVTQILDRKGAFIESEDLMKEYEEDRARYEKISRLTGEQFVARGTAAFEAADKDDDENEYRYSAIPMIRHGADALVVIDDEVDMGDHTPHASTTFWTKGKGDDDDGDEGKDYEIPVHPVVRIFDLWRHIFVTIHVSNLTEYPYNPKIIDKIVLPDSHKRLIEALVVGTVRKMEDVVKGKAAGIIILSKGSPGTGKTLTAEVYGEVAKRPLYTVQCSQLGTDSDSLEKNLSRALERATRWRAILLIDEADVYIYERGHDVQQNAIVGVFLRLLEYFNGILFMNTNREDVIDDAIESRATATIVYRNPDSEKAERIWRILLAQYEIQNGDKLLSACLKKWPAISGRNIRQIIRLGKMLADQEKRPVTIADFEFSAGFQNLPDHVGKV